MGVKVIGLKVRQRNPPKEELYQLFPEKGRLPSGRKYVMRETGDNEFLFIVETIDAGEYRVFKVKVTEAIPGVGREETIIKNAKRILEVVDIGDDDE